MNEQPVEAEAASINSGKSKVTPGQRVVVEDASSAPNKLPLSKRILSIMWDSLDKSPEERAFIAKIDWWILSYCCVAYWSKYLSQTNASL